jgi:hypothetical protein
MHKFMKLNNLWRGIHALQSHCLFRNYWIWCVRHDVLSFNFILSIVFQTFRKADFVSVVIYKTTKIPCRLCPSELASIPGRPFLFQFTAVAVLASLIGSSMPAPQGPPPGRNYSPRFLPLTPQGYVPIVSENFDLNPVDNSYNFK